MTRSLLAEPNPVAFLMHASTGAELMTGPQDPDEPLDLAEFVEALHHSGTIESEAMLRALDSLVPGSVPPPYLERIHRLPGWVYNLPLARVTAALQMHDFRGDTDQVVMQVEIPEAPPFSILVLVDHRAGSSIADGAPLPVPLDDVRARALQFDPPLGFTGIRVADAAVRLRESDESTSTLLDPPESDTWPALRPLLRWLLRLMPRDGQGWPRQDWSPEQLETLTAKVLASEGRPLSDDVRDAVQTLLEYASRHALGDPLHWSEQSTIAALDWIDTHVVADDRWHAAVPTALRAVVRYAHDAKDVPFDIRDEVMAVIDEDDEPGGALRDLQAAFERYLPDDQLRPEMLLDRLAQRVGGEEALDALQTEAPDPALSVPEDVEPRLAELTELISPIVADFFADPEIGEVAVTLLRRVAAANPALYRRRSDPRMLAAAATWIVAKVNDAFEDRTVQDMTAAFGAKGSPSQRATALLSSLGLGPWTGPWGSFLGDPGLLTGTSRRRIVQQRDSARVGITTGDDGLPTQVSLAGGETVRVGRDPGLAAGVMEEMRPYLAEQGVDLDDVQDLASLQAALDVAAERRNAALFSATGARRAAALATLRQVSLALAVGNDDVAVEALDRVEPEAHRPEIAEVSAVIGLGLELLDQWLGGMPEGVPIGLVRAIRLPDVCRKRARPGREILALAAQGRAIASIGALIGRHGGHQVMDGTAIVVAATLRAWAERAGRPIDLVATERLR